MRYAKCTATVLLLVAALTSGCASTFELSGDAKSLREQLTAARATSVLDKYVKSAVDRGGLCMIGVTQGTRLDDSQPITTTGSVVRFAAFYAVPGGSQVQGSVVAGTGQVVSRYHIRRGTLTTDARTIREIRLLEVNKYLQAACVGAKPGHLVVLKTEAGLPDQAEVAINTTSAAQLDELLAALTYFSPRARLVKGVGM